MLDDCCDEHKLFHWECDDCENVYQRNRYQEVKEHKEFCKACKKNVSSFTYKRHTKSKIHQAMARAAN